MTRYGVLIVALLLAAGIRPASEQSLQEVKDAMEMMVGSSAICRGYLGRTEILENTRQLARDQFAKVGWSSADADAYSDEIAAKAMAEPSNEMQKQVACEIINIQALK